MSDTRKTPPGKRRVEMAGYPLSDLQRAYVEVDARRARCVEQGGETAAIAVLTLSEVLALILEIDPNADTGTPVPGRVYDRFDGDLQFDDDPGASYGQE